MWGEYLHSSGGEAAWKQGLRDIDAKSRGRFCCISGFGYAIHLLTNESQQTRRHVFKQTISYTQAGMFYQYVNRSIFTFRSIIHWSCDNSMNGLRKSSPGCPNKIQRVKSQAACHFLSVNSLPNWKFLMFWFFFFYFLYNYSEKQHSTRSG